MREFVVRTCLFIDLLNAVPLLAVLIFVDPEKYVKALESGDSIRKRILQYRRKET